MISNVSFGQTTKIAQQGQAKAPQTVYNATPQEQADSYTSSTKKKSSPIKKFLATAVVVLGGSALATKMPAVKKAVEKIANGTEKANIVDKALNAVNKLGEKVIEVAAKVKGAFKKSSEPVKAREIKTEADLKEFLHHKNNPELKKGYENLMKGFGEESAKNTIKASKDTTSKVHLSLPKDATKKAMEEDMKKAVQEKAETSKIKKQIFFDKLKNIFKKDANVDEVVKDSSKMSKKAQKRVKTRRVADEIQKWKTHNPNDVIIMGDGSPILALPTPEQVDKTMQRMANK